MHSGNNHCSEDFFLKTLYLWPIAICIYTKHTIYSTWESSRQDLVQGAESLQYACSAIGYQGMMSNFIFPFDLMRPHPKEWRTRACSTVVFEASIDFSFPSSIPHVYMPITTFHNHLLNSNIIISLNLFDKSKLVMHMIYI
jgi:hypothetical protein